MFQQNKLHELLKLLCANSATQLKIEEALRDEIQMCEREASEAARKALFDEAARPVAYGALAVQSYLEGLLHVVQPVRS